MMRMSIVWCAITLNLRILAALVQSSLRKKKQFLVCYSEIL